VRLFDHESYDQYSRMLQIAARSGRVLASPRHALISSLCTLHFLQRLMHFCRALLSASDCSECGKGEIVTSKS